MSLEFFDKHHRTKTPQGESIVVVRPEFDLDALDLRRQRKTGIAPKNQIMKHC